MKNKNKKKFINAKKVLLFAFCFLLLFVLLNKALAASSDYQNQEKIPGYDQTSDFITYIQYILKFGYNIIGILALFMLIIGAYQYLIAGGTGKVAGAKETIVSALLGLILGMCAYIVLNKINPDLVNFRSITEIESTTTDTAGSTSSSYQNQEKIPGYAQTSDFKTYIQNILNFGYAVIGILALFMLMIGAYQYLIAAGTGNTASAKETVTSALLGLILGVCAYIILNKINPDLVKFRDITEISSESSS